MRDRGTAFALQTVPTTPWAWRAIPLSSRTQSRGGAQPLRGPQAAQVVGRWRANLPGRACVGEPLPCVGRTCGLRSTDTTAVPGHRHSKEPRLAPGLGAHPPRRPQAQPWTAGGPDRARQTGTRLPTRRRFASGPSGTDPITPPAPRRSACQDRCDPLPVDHTPCRANGLAKTGPHCPASLPKSQGAEMKALRFPAARKRRTLAGPGLRGWAGGLPRLPRRGTRRAPHQSPTPLVDQYPRCRLLRGL
jgi:hypothetical protein